MNYSNPADFGDKPIVLTDLYPFIRPRAYGKPVSSASLKLECLIQGACSIPGSMAIEDADLRTLVRSNIDLITAGALVLDLRNSVKSYNELVKIKFGSSATREMWEMADLLDEKCPTVIHFDPHGASDSYKRDLRNFLSALRGRCKNGHEIKSIDKIIDRVDKSESLSYDAASKLKTNIEYIDKRIYSAAKFLYCTCGSHFVNGIAQVPHELWENVHAESKVAYVSAQEATEATDMSVAHAAVLEHFGVVAAAFDRLKARDIVELRTDGATRSMLSALRAIVCDANEQFARTGIFQRDTLIDMAECRAFISARVREKCLAQARRSGLSEYGGIGVDEGMALGMDLAGWIAPPIGSIRKAALRVGRVISRMNPALAKLDVTFTPIQTYVSRLQTRIGTRA